MAEIDFITAFGRLLRDGTVRDAFAANPQAVAEHFQLRRSDWPAWRQLVPADVEFQAEVLLRKRLDQVTFFAPETCGRLGSQLWPTFRDYARIHWPPDGGAKMLDAFEFCRQLRQTDGQAVVAVEWNRIRFALSKWPAAFYRVQTPGQDGKLRHGLQIFLRGGGPRWWESFFYFGL